MAVCVQILNIRGWLQFQASVACMMTRFRAVMKSYFLSDIVHRKLQNIKISLFDPAPVRINRSFITALCDSKMCLEMCIFQIHLDIHNLSLSRSDRHFYSVTEIITSDITFTHTRMRKEISKYILHFLLVKHFLFLIAGLIIFH